MPERCLLDGVLGMGCPIPLHATQSEQRVVDAWDGRATDLASGVNFGIIARRHGGNIGV